MWRVVFRLFLVWVPLSWIIITCLKGLRNRVTKEKALAEFRRKAGTDDIVIDSHSNMWPFIGDPHDVTFELLIEGELVKGRCTSGAFMPLICKLPAKWPK